MITIVEFGDGTYGIRKRSWFESRFLDLANSNYWWGEGSIFFRSDCRSKNLPEVYKKYLTLKSKVTPLTEDEVRQRLDQLQSSSK